MYFIELIYIGGNRLNYKQLKIFVLVCKHHHLQQVADIMGCKQPTVTFHLKKLEELAGVPLFKHQHKFFSLTDAGQELLTYAQQIVRLTDDAMWLLNDYKQHKKGAITIGSSHTPAIYYIPNLLSLLLDKYTFIQPKLKVSGNSPQIITLLKEFEIDLGLITDTAFHDPELTAIPVTKDELGLVIHPDHPFAEKDAISLMNMLPMNRTPLLLREKGSSSRQLFDDWAASQSIYYTSYMELGSTEVIKQAVRSNIGVAPLSNLAVVQEVKEKQLLFRSIDRNRLTRNVYLAYHKHRRLTPTMKEYINVFQEG